MHNYGKWAVSRVALFARGECMKDLLILVGVIVLWFVLQKYILPYFGVPT